MTLETCVLNNLKLNLDEPEEIVEPWFQILKALINVLEHDNLKGLENMIIDQMQCRRTARIKALLLIVLFPLILIFLRDGFPYIPFVCEYSKCNLFVFGAERLAMDYNVALICYGGIQ